MSTVQRNWSDWSLSYGGLNTRQPNGWQPLVMIFLLLLILSQVGRSQTIATDKLLHLSAGYVISTGTTATLRYHGVKNPELWGIAAGFAAGIIKEVIDTRPDPADAYATMWGAMIGGVVITMPIHGKDKNSRRGN